MPPSWYHVNLNGSCASAADTFQVSEWGQDFDPVAIVFNYLPRPKSLPAWMWHHTYLWSEEAPMLSYLASCLLKRSTGGSVNRYPLILSCE